MATTPVLDVLANPIGCNFFTNSSISFFNAEISSTKDLSVLSKIVYLYFLHNFLAFSSFVFEETTLNKVIRTGYSLLNLKTFFTSGEQETRAWTIKNGSTAQNAAGKIHSDFEKGFIRAETIAYEDFVKYNGETSSREAGKLRQEGKEYKVKDGDVFHF